jgi:hypothetical protein
MKRLKVEPKMKIIWNNLGEGIWLMKFILMSNFEKNLRITPEELEESGKILGINLWVRAHSKGNTVEMIAWNRDCTGKINWLEWDNNLELAWIDAEWKHDSSEISSALRNKWIAGGEWLRGAPAWKSIWKDERDMINTKSLHWIHRRRKKNEEWKNDELETPEHLHEETPDKNIEGKNEETSHP